MEFTGERFVPNVDGEIKYEHLHRYALSLEYVGGKSVLDIASGEGYGAALLAQVAQAVTGIDIDSDSVDHSKHRYYYPNLNFLVGSCQSIPLPDTSVDVITSFETIEHHDDHEIMMQECKRVLKPGGVLIISSPNRLIYTDEANYANPFHVKELYFDEFYKLLGQHFKHVQIYGQRLATGSFVYLLENSSAKTYKAFTGDAYHLHQKVASIPAPVYFIAVCSDSQLNNLHAIDSVYVDGKDDLLKMSETEKENFIKSLESQIEQYEQELSSVRAQYEAQKNQFDQEMSVVLSQYGIQINQFDKELSKARAQYEAQKKQYEQELSSVRAQHEAQLNQFEEKMSGVRAQYEEQIELEREKLLAKDRQLLELSKQLRHHQQLLNEKEQALELSNLVVKEYQTQENGHLLKTVDSLQGTKDQQIQQHQLGSPLLAPAPESFKEAALLQDIQRQLSEREQYYRAKDLQLEEMEQRIQMYHQVVEKFGQSGSYRLGRFLTWPLRQVKKLLT